jgi:glycosyltransferase involved in cell wall biosynthesis
MNKPEISVVTAVYNRENYIKRAINSLLKQTYSNWELIVIDDGSMDNTPAILREYQAKYKNIKVVRTKHTNLSSSRNAGIELSGGKYITFLDSDDEFLPSHLETRYNYMTNHPDIDLLHGGITVIGESFVADKDDLNKYIPLSDCAIGATFFGKSEVFESLGGFNELQYGEDSEFLERAEKIFKVEKAHYPTYVYHRDTPDSITNRIRQAEE